MSDTVKIADIVRGKRKRVKIRVPSHLQPRLGSTAKGRVDSVYRKKSVAWVKVKVGDAMFDFRPQDLDPA